MILMWYFSPNHLLLSCSVFVFSQSRYRGSAYPMGRMRVCLSLSLCDVGVLWLNDKTGRFGFIVRVTNLPQKRARVKRGNFGTLSIFACKIFIYWSIRAPERVSYVVERFVCWPFSRSTQKVVNEFSWSWKGYKEQSIRFLVWSGRTRLIFARWLLHGNFAPLHT